MEMQELGCPAEVCAIEKERIWREGGEEHTMVIFEGII